MHSFPSGPPERGFHRFEVNSSTIFVAFRHGHHSMDARVKIAHDDVGEASFEARAYARAPQDDG
jgi:hypothetical protein